MRKLLLFMCMAMPLATIYAQTTDEKRESKTIKLPDWLTNVKLSGYALLQYQASTQEGAKSNSFNLRMARIALDGRIANDFYWKIQMQVNGNTATLGSSPSCRFVCRMAEIFFCKD